MCIVCGGICGGAGDVLLPSMVAGAGLAILGVRANRERMSNKASELWRGGGSRTASDPVEDEQSPSR